MAKGHHFFFSYSAPSQISLVIEGISLTSWPTVVAAETTLNAMIIKQGPVVQSIFSLTSSLRGQLIKCFMTL